MLPPTLGRIGLRHGLTPAGPRCRNNNGRAPHSGSAHPLAEAIAALPKAELHVHLEGTIQPSTVVELAARYGDSVAQGQVAARYASRDFAGFIEAYKWVTSYLRAPEDYALVAREAA